MNDILCYVEENRQLLTDVNCLLMILYNLFIELRDIIDSDKPDKTIIIKKILETTYQTENKNIIKVIKSNPGSTIYRATYRLPDGKLSTIVLCEIDNIVLQDDNIKFGNKQYNLSDKKNIRKNIDNNLYLVINAHNLLHNIV